MIFQVVFVLFACSLVAQLCPMLCNSFYCSPPGSSVYGISQIRILEWVAFLSSGDFPDQGIEPPTPALQVGSLPLGHQGSVDLILGRGYFSGYIVHASLLQLHLPSSAHLSSYHDRCYSLIEWLILPFPCRARGPWRCRIRASMEMGIPDHLTCLLRNLYAGQEATVRTGHGTTDWFQIGKGVFQGCILSSCLFNLYAKYIMRNARLEEAQAGIKIAGRNFNNLRYADIWGKKVKN